MTEGGLSVAQASRDLGISESVLGRWKRQFMEDPAEAFPGKGRLKSQDEELVRLRRENEVLRLERDILKKCSGHLFAAAQVIYQFVHDHREGFQVRRMCRVLEVSSSGDYAWMRRGESRRVREDRRLLVAINSIHQENRRAYGSPRIHAEVKDWHMHHGRKRVARMMRENGIRAKQKKKLKVTTGSKHSHPVTPNLLQRNFDADMPDQKWLADITYSAPGSWRWHGDACRDSSMTGIQMDRARMR